MIFNASLFGIFSPKQTIITGTYTFSTPVEAVLLVLTTQGGANPQFRTAHIVWCAISGYTGTVVDLRVTTSITVSQSNGTLTVDKTTAGTAYLTIIRLA